eukprot:CAMPEP_0115887016 /NCGR_PEP_ID=MMETSP0287-20121206/31527_1 /TAXON_ID=412157 /ORGANISM="Chrysochromulina rotalis, Strain UIO044" /LENGTH=113 /DNA_ID=CAMNT_0003343561 /DNA_START=37 /DNA_END=378 /DNA_ORIENTATION=+
MDQGIVAWRVWRPDISVTRRTGKWAHGRMAVAKRAPRCAAQQQHARHPIALRARFPRHIRFLKIPGGGCADTPSPTVGYCVLELVHVDETIAVGIHTSHEPLALSNAHVLPRH